MRNGAEHDSKIADDLSAFSNLREMAGQFANVASAKPGIKAAESRKPEGCSPRPRRANAGAFCFVSKLV